MGPLPFCPTGPVPCCPYGPRTVLPYRSRTVLPVWAPYRFAPTAPVPFCPYRSRTILLVWAPYRFARTGLVPFCPYRPVLFCPYRSCTVLPVPVPYHFTLMLLKLAFAPSWSRLLHPFHSFLTSSFCLPVLSTIFHSKIFLHDTSVLPLLSYSLSVPNQPFSCIYLQHNSSLYSSSCSLRSPSDPACLPCAASRVGGGWDPVAEVPREVQHTSSAQTSPRRVVGLARPNQSAGRALP